MPVVDGRLRGHDEKTQRTPLRNEIEARAPDRLVEATEAAAARIAARFGSGPIDGKIQALVITAHA